MLQIKTFSRNFGKKKPLSLGGASGLQLSPKGRSSLIKFDHHRSLFSSASFSVKPKFQTVLRTPQKFSFGNGLLTRNFHQNPKQNLLFSRQKTPIFNIHSTLQTKALSSIQVPQRVLKTTVPSLSTLSLESPIQQLRSYHPSSFHSIQLQGSFPQKQRAGRDNIFARMKVHNSETEDPRDIEDFEMPPNLKQSLKAKGIDKLFPIQSVTFDTIKEGRNLIGKAKTGTGKTLAFLLPILAKIFENPALRSSKRPKALVVAPTRELANQIIEEINSLSGGVIRSISIHGGVSYTPQEQKLSSGVDIVVGTPGRMLDLIEKGSLVLSDVKFVTLDEADEMLKRGFQEEIETIFERCAKLEERQTLLFSATIPPWIQNVADRYLGKDYEFISVESPNSELKTPEKLKHTAIPAPSASAIPAMVKSLVNAHPDKKILVFAPTKMQTQLIGEQVPHSRILHGDVSQSGRDLAIQAIKNDKCRVVIATDVAARGLDIPNMDLVIHAGMPPQTDSYIHRSGRTARAGKEGRSILIFDQRKDMFDVIQLARTVGIQLEHATISPPNGSDVLEKIHSFKVPHPLLHKELNDIVETILEDPQKARSTLLNILGSFATGHSALSLHPHMATIGVDLSSGFPPQRAYQELKLLTGAELDSALLTSEKLYLDVPLRSYSQILNAKLKFTVEPVPELPSGIDCTRSLQAAQSIVNPHAGRPNPRGQRSRGDSYQKGSRDSYRGSSRGDAYPGSYQKGGRGYGRGDYQSSGYGRGDYQSGGYGRGDYQSGGYGRGDYQKGSNNYDRSKSYPQERKSGRNFAQELNRGQSKFTF